VAQVKIYGLGSTLRPIRVTLSAVLHGCLRDILGLPPDKRFHRFFPLDREDFVFPDDRSDHYLILEISMFEGRTTETKKALIRAIFARFEEDLGIRPQDVEITIFETPRQNWGIRGLPGDELALSYKVEK
jgi:phenylpyruvate tautomerase PptA (4-oxalocrotonate tautomerase family)